MQVGNSALTEVSGREDNKQTMMQEIECVLCGSRNGKVLYQTIDLKVSHYWFNVVKCKNCGLVYTNPRPLENRIGDYYDDSYYAYKPYGVKKDKMGQSSTPLGRILEIGCGSGEWLYKQRMLGNDVYGVEINKDAVRIANESGLNVFLGKLKEAKFPSDFFDLINICQVLEHLFNPLEDLVIMDPIIRTIC